MSRTTCKIQCPFCDLKITFQTHFVKHLNKEHNYNIQNDKDLADLYIEIKLNNVEPLCKCGCGVRTKFYDWKRGFVQYLCGHNGFPDDKEIYKKSADARRKSYAAGKFKVWNTGLTKDTDPRMKRISETSGKTLRKRYESGDLVSWQKDLTKEDPRIAQCLETRKNNGFQSWNTGLTKYTDERLAKCSKSLSQVRAIHKWSGPKVTFEELRRRADTIKHLFVITDEALKTLYVHKSTLLPFECTTCKNIQYKTLTNILLTPRCFNCYPAGSFAQQQIYEFVKNDLFFEDTLYNDRKAIAPKELDVFIPSRKFAIEYNGLYWHSDIRYSNIENKHQEKLDLCIDNNIELFIVYEDEWKYNESLVKDKIKEKLGLCELKTCDDFDIVELDEEITSDFCCTHDFDYKQGDLIFGIVSNTEQIIYAVVVLEHKESDVYVKQFVSVCGCDQNLIKALFEYVIEYIKSNNYNLFVETSENINKEFLIDLGMTYVSFKQQIWATNHLRRYEILPENDLSDTECSSLIYDTRVDLFTMSYNNQQ